MLSIFVLLVSLHMLPPWADLVTLLFSIKNVVCDAGKLFINLQKYEKHMKTSIIRFVLETKLVWNMVG